VQKLVQKYGISVHAAEKGIYKTKDQPGDPFTNAFKWLKAHHEDPDFNEELIILPKEYASPDARRRGLALI